MSLNSQDGNRRDRPIRMLQVTTVPVTLRRFISPFAKHFRKKGWIVDAAASGIESDEQCQRHFDQCFDVPFSRSLFSPSNVTQGGKRIAQIAEQGKYDIVHVHTPIAAFVTRYSLRNRNPLQKLVYTAHGFHFYDGGPKLKSAIFRTAEKIASRWMDRLIVINQMDYQNALRAGFGTQANIKFMQGIGVDLKEFRVPADAAQTRIRLREQLAIPQNAFVFLQVAERSSNKRQEDAIAALAIAKENESFHLVFAGDGTDSRPLRDLAIELGVEERVHGLGFRTDVVDLLVASDVVLLISEREGLPRSLMEALAMEKRAIGTKIRGTTDLLGNGVGLLVPPKDPQALAIAMAQSQSFESDSDARHAVLEACSLPRIIQQHEELYDSLLGRDSSVSQVDMSDSAGDASVEPMPSLADLS